MKTSLKTWINTPVAAPSIVRDESPTPHPQRLAITGLAMNAVASRLILAQWQRAGVFIPTSNRPPRERFNK